MVKKMMEAYEIQKSTKKGKKIKKNTSSCPKEK